MAIRKQGISFYPAVSLAPTQTGLASTFTGKFRLEGNNGSWTSFPNAFAEVSPGFYQSPIVIEAAGTYDVVVESTNVNVSTINSKVVIVAATTDDIALALTAAQADITSILNKVDVLDDTLLASIGAGVTDIDTKLAELKALMSDEEDPAIISLRELLQEIIAAGSTRDSVIAALTSYTDDIENMIKGSEFLQDGSVNPFFGKTTHDVYDKLTDIATLLGQTISSATTTVTNAIDAAKTELATVINTVNTAVQANNAVLTGTDGLAVIHAAITAVQATLGADTTSIADQFAAVTASLTGLDTSITSFRTSVETKLDTIETKIDGVAAAQANTWTATAVM